MSVNSNKIQLKAFELELLGFSATKIAKMLYHEFDMAYEIRATDVQTLINAETILYGIASMANDKTPLNRIAFKDDEVSTMDICVWADYSWCLVDELEEYGSNKSDDYITATVDVVDEPTLTQLKHLVDNGVNTLRP